MSPYLRTTFFALVLGAGALAGQASAQRDVARLEPGYGGVCEECDLSGRILAGARMTNSVFNRSNFSNAVLARADASRSQFEGANFSDADLRRARLVNARCPRARFDRAILVQTDARGADFTRASFSSADVTRMNLRDANLSGADLRNARGLTQAQLDQACGDRRTRLPRGLRVEMCA